MRPWFTHDPQRTPDASPAAPARVLVLLVAALALPLAAPRPAGSDTTAPPPVADTAPDPAFAAVPQAGGAAAAVAASAAPEAHRTPEPVRVAPARPAPAAALRVAPPADLRRVGDWIAYLNARHLASLPAESRIFYRRGLMAKQARQDDQALVDVRGAAELDPTFVEPHLTIAAWMLTRDPSQALQQYAAVIALLRQDFNLQLGLAANATLVGFEALYVGLLLASLVLVWLRRDELTHGWQERLAPLATRGGARWWALGIFALPYLAGLGLTLPTVAYLACLWPNLRARERVLATLLFTVAVCTPLVLGVVERFSLPLHGGAAPFYDVSQIENAPWSRAREEHLAALAHAQPDNGIVQFGLGWESRRGGHLAAAEAAYRRVVQLQPGDDRALTNLGNVLAMEGRTDDALASYRNALTANPSNAAAWFNSGQLHTQRFEYAAATEALSRASALNFELVRSYQSQATTDGLLPLIDQWQQPRVFWATLRSAPIPREMAGAVPIGLRRHVEASGWRFSERAVVLARAGFAAGGLRHRRLHLRNCGNCGAIVCRRCAERRREQALCPACAVLEARAETPELGRLLLVRHRRERLRRLRLVETALASLLPGYGLLSHRRVFTPVLLIALTWLLLMAWLGAAPPFSVEPRLTLPGDEVPSLVVVVALAFVYAASLLGWLHQSEKARAREAELNATSRGRVTQSTRRVMHTAA